MGPVRKHACLALGKKELGLREEMVLCPKDSREGWRAGRSLALFYRATRYPSISGKPWSSWLSPLLSRPPIPLDFESLLLCGRDVTSYLLHTYTLCLLWTSAGMTVSHSPVRHSSPATYLSTIIHVHTLSWVLVTKVDSYHGTLCSQVPPAG